ncbi:MAG: hypothetical protein M1836_005205 [Candelina mexicana]|nr:MAG: hypothetical protein M1836_005205 [Candelina mexicana]
MNGYLDVNGHTSPAQRQHAHSANPMPLTNGSSYLPHQLLNPRAAQMANGTPLTSTSISNPATLQFQRASSEPSQATNYQPLTSSFLTSSSDLNDATLQNLTFQGIPRSQKASSLIGEIARPQTHFDPRALLNPKGYLQRPPSPKKKEEPLIPEKPHTKRLWSESQDTSQSQPLNGGVKPRHDTEVHGQGMGNFIERMHNVSKREERPSKKQKCGSEVDGEEKAAFAGGSKDGVLGQYVKKRKEEGRNEAGTTSTVVDLTGDDDEEVVVVGETADKVVCFGRIEGARVQAHKVPSPNPNAKALSKTTWPMIKVELKHLHANNHIISVTDPCGNDFGNVDVRTAQALVPLMSSKSASIRLQARVPPRLKNGLEAPGMPMSGTFELNINVYGKQKQGVMIGRLFSQKQVWLRTPLLVDSGIEICNPHAPKAGAPPKTASSAGTSSGMSGGFVSRTVEEIRSDVMGMFDSLEKSDALPEMEADPRIITPLLIHQKQGLYFMMKREEGRVYSTTEEDKKSLWRLHIRPNGQRMYYNVITGQEERKKPPEVLGGILADMMGLGKTLSILSLIVSTLDESQSWAEERPPPQQTPEDVPLLRNSKTTLLVSPLSTIANWEEQIKTHIQPGTLKYHIYHGPNRCTDVNELAEYDVVITTYQIVLSQFLKQGKSGKNPLLQTNWFRIVLDEAHTIREQSTKQSQAICCLIAQRRWAVTGTPIQNRLDDLGALIKFLRIKPFDEKGGFTQFILSPFKMADPEILPKLRLLVDSITLRRHKDRINLPARHDQLVRLKFSDEERSLYDWFAKDSDSKMRAVTNDKKKLGGRVYVHILRAILRLRLFCAHGKELLSDEDMKMTEGFSMNNAIDLEDENDEKPALPPKQAYDMLNLLKQSGADNCAQCQRKIGPKEQPIEDTPSDKDETIGYMTPCYQILCIHCISAFKDTVQQIATADNHVVCPLCEQYVRISYFELKQGKVEEDEDARLMARDNPRLAKQMGRYGGPHTKTKALIAALHESHAESMMNPDERPIKSVIFSGWTSHLDLLQIALEDNKIAFVRLDGKMSRIKRSAALDAFRDDPSITVILVSIMAGGLGLNLTTANKVYVMEPQFNPAAEAQAIDRVHRLGQTREVTATRFIMDESFEEKMLELQKKKQNLADLSMGRGKLDRSEMAKQKLEELRSLFR